MSIASEIARLQQAKADLKTAINNKGGNITNETIDQFSTVVDSIATAIELTQAQYDALETKDANTYYLIVEEEPSYPPYVVFKSDSPRTITPKYTNSGITLQYSIDKGTTWNTISSDIATPSSIEIWFRGCAVGVKSLYTSNSTSNAWVFSGDGSNKLHVYGDLRYLLCDNLGDNTITFNIASYCYASMFHRCTSLTTPPSLPATTLANYCYHGMFYGCTSLATAPQLPAATLAEDCYSYMFSGCTNLTEAPSLLAITLANSCYRYMFGNCTSLTTAPSLPATTLADFCYSYMFSGCTSLTEAPPSLPATTLAEGCYYYMFDGCTSLTEALPSLPATTLAKDCYHGMFSGCISLATAPSLPATTLAEGCYCLMFEGCTSLTTAPSLPATTLADFCYSHMFYNCESLTTAPSLPATTLAEGCYYYMFGNCTAFKVSATKTGTYQYSWRIPTSGTGTTADFWNVMMLENTGGTYTDNPTINTTYYVENPPV